MDTRGIHARMCRAGGDGVIRHNALRNYLYRVALGAGLNPVLEKPGILLPASPDDDDQSRRRPADIYLPAWNGDYLLH